MTEKILAKMLARQSCCQFTVPSTTISPQRPQIRTLLETPPDLVTRGRNAGLADETWYWDMTKNDVNILEYYLFHTPSPGWKPDRLSKVMRNSPYKSAAARFFRKYRRVKVSATKVTLVSVPYQKWGSAQTQQIRTAIGEFLDLSLSSDQRNLRGLRNSYPESEVRNTYH